MITLRRSAVSGTAVDSERMEAAFRSASDAVMIDLEDGVALNRKDEARSKTADLVNKSNEKPIWVRVNSPSSGLWKDDIDALGESNVECVIVAKTETADEIRAVAEELDKVRSPARIRCLLESAVGIKNAFEIASAHHRVVNLHASRVDLAADLNVPGEEGLLHAFSQVIIASRAAGLPSPMLTVYLTHNDPEGLRASTERGKRMGFFGRRANHVDQVSVINEVFTPTVEEVREAKREKEAFESATKDGVGLFFLDGRVVDIATIKRVDRILELANVFGARDD